jgi:uncharacterized protein (DUF58 family)
MISLQYINKRSQSVQSLSVKSVRLLFQRFLSRTQATLVSVIVILLLILLLLLFLLFLLLLYSTSYLTDDCSHQRSLIERAKNGNRYVTLRQEIQFAHELLINSGTEHIKTTLNRQRRQVYRVYIVMQFGHGQNNNMFLHMPIS